MRNKSGRRKIVWWKFLIGLVAGAGLLFGGMYLYFLWAGANLLRHELAQAKAAGMPLTQEELFARPSPGNGNAAFILKSLCKKLADDEEVLQTMLVLSNDEAADAQAIRQKEPLLRTALAELQLREYAVEVDYEATPAFDYKELRGLERLGYLIAHSACLLAAEGKVREAFERLDAAMNLAECVGRKPSGYTFRFRYKMEKEVYRALEWLTLETPTKEVLQCASLFVGKTRAPYDLKRSVAGDLMLQRALLASVKNGASVKDVLGMEDSELTIGERWAVATMFSPTFRDGYEARFIRMLRIGYMGMPADSLNYKAAVGSFNTMMHVPSTESWCYSSAMQLAGFDSEMAEVPIKALLRARVSQAAISAAFKKGLGTDPITAKPFLVSTAGGAQFIYSVGPDGIDNNADPEADIVVQVPPVR